MLVTALFSVHPKRKTALEALLRGLGASVALEAPVEFLESEYAEQVLRAARHEAGAGDGRKQGRAKPRVPAKQQHAGADGGLAGTAREDAAEEPGRRDGDDGAEERPVLREESRPVSRAE